MPKSRKLAHNVIQRFGYPYTIRISTRHVVPQCGINSHVAVEQPASVLTFCERKLNEPFAFARDDLGKSHAQTLNLEISGTMKEK